MVNPKYTSKVVPAVNTLNLTDTQKDNLKIFWVFEVLINVFVSFIIFSVIILIPLGITLESNYS